MTRPFLRPADRPPLLRAAVLAPCPAVRSRARWLLWLDRGLSVAELARAARVSRPTVYQVLRAWAVRHQVEDLRPGAVRWKRSGPAHASGRP